MLWYYASTCARCFLNIMEFWFKAIRDDSQQVVSRPYIHSMCIGMRHTHCGFFMLCAVLVNMMLESECVLWYHVSLFQFTDLDFLIYGHSSIMFNITKRHQQENYKRTKKNEHFNWSLILCHFINFNRKIDWKLMCRYCFFFMCCICCVCVCLNY